MISSVRSKIEKGNIRNALQLLSSTDTVAPVTEETIGFLREKHLNAPSNRKECLTKEASSLTVNSQQVLHCLKSFPKGTSDGRDGLTPAHLRDVTSSKADSSDLVNLIASFVNLILSGNCRPENVGSAVKNDTVRPSFYAQDLMDGQFTLNKKLAHYKLNAYKCIRAADESPVGTIHAQPIQTNTVFSSFHSRSLLFLVRCSLTSAQQQQIVDPDEIEETNNGSCHTNANLRYNNKGLIPAIQPHPSRLPTHTRRSGEKVLSD
ncbi:hypothetical protein HELRODRAFT_163781 [Helobdella robusta]|uniref:Uncharacterized protein n=1 Tax=Helobdella robusta TaxID=6412 RepID=T1EUG8_HELRO|nr:hypothetical protein HELRODRAFT_163781 [Helobdella robusta]ESN96682.1 hypothetical protein HELRODRAFT_163781 [Helobdella robusta]